MELEKRIATLEVALGEDRLQGSLEGGSLIQKFESMEETMSTLNEQKLIEVGQKIQKLNVDIESVGEKNKKGLENLRPDEVKKIEDLWFKMQKVQGISDELPTIVNRFEGLKSLHEESAGIMMQLKSLVIVHDKIFEQLNIN